MKLPRKDNGSLDWKLIIVGKDWKTFLVWTGLTIAILLMAYGYKHDNQQYMEVYQNPCKFCQTCQVTGQGDLNKLDVISIDIEPYGEREEKTNTNIAPGNG